MPKMLLQLTALCSVVVGSAILVAVSGCANSTANDAVQTAAVREMFPSATHVTEISLERDRQESEPSRHPVVREVRGPSGLLGFSVVSEVVGRSGPFRIHVLLDSRYVVRKAAVISYPWSHGRGVTGRSFGSQFLGKGPADPIKLGEDIDAVAGATISSQAMTEGVRDVVKLLAERE